MVGDSTSTTRGFVDHFSVVARTYAAFRPSYPDALFDWLASVAPGRRLAWDCACGSGQAAKALARRFDLVAGTDASLAQILGARAQRSREWGRVVGLAEHAPLATGSADLLTIAQALHWLDSTALWPEARRVLRPGGVVACWGYLLMGVVGGVDDVIRWYYDEIVGPYWPANRRILESGFAEVPFPFERLEPPVLEMTAEWTLDQLLGYVGTWSASARYRAARGSDPLLLLRPRLVAVWGDPQVRRTVRWPLAMQVGRVGS